MIYAKQRSAKLTGLLSLCAIACTRMTNVGSDVPAAQPPLMAGAPAPPVATAPFNPPQAGPATAVSCAASETSGLIRGIEQGTCDFELEACTDGRSYAMACDGLTCTCHATGSAPTTFLTPRCPDLAEVNRGCGWLLTHTVGVLAQGASAGARCSHNGPIPSADPLCSCRNGIVQCSDSKGCFLSGRWLPADESFVLTLGVDGTLWASNNLRAMLSDVRNGTAPGYYGTWQASQDVLSLRTIHPPQIEACGTDAGRYAIRMSSECDLLELQRESDTCAGRALLAGTVLHREPPVAVPTE